MSRINQAIHDALVPEKAIAAIEELDSVPGIGLATASAILTVCYPDDFTIIDWHVLEELGLEPAAADAWSARQYIVRLSTEGEKSC